MRWAALNCLSLWTKIFALSIFVKFGSLTRLKFEIAEYFSTGSSKAKTLLENSATKRKTKLQVRIERVSTGNVSKKKRYC